MRVYKRAGIQTNFNTVRKQVVVTNITTHEQVDQLRKLWFELHTTVTTHTLGSWEAKLRSLGMCSCATKYDKIKKANPPRTDDFFVWTWEIHNEVNINLDKPTFSLQDAIIKWKDISPVSTETQQTNV